MEETILQRLVALNAERAAEERRGLVRWLRPDFQNPGGQPAPSRPRRSGRPPTPTASGPKPDWPKTLPEQFQALRAALAARPGPGQRRRPGPVLHPRAARQGRRTPGDPGQPRPSPAAWRMAATSPADPHGGTQGAGHRRTLLGRCLLNQTQPLQRATHHSCPIPTMSHETPWHLMPSAQVLIDLGSSTDGLAADEVARRLAQSGPNELPGADVVSPWAIFGAQFQNVLILILLAAVALSRYSAKSWRPWSSPSSCCSRSLLGFVQEYRAERAMEALRRMAAPTARVLRDGEELEIPARELVPGDVVLPAAGDRVPADLRLIEAVNLRMEEAALTGESQAGRESTAARS